MKLVLFQAAGRGGVMPGLLTDRGVVSIADVVTLGHTPQLTMQGIIDSFDSLRSALEHRAVAGAVLPLSDVRLRAPLPRPGKILACIANYWEHGALEARPLNMFLKNSDAVIGPGDTIVLPEHTEPWIFMHEAELAVVIKGPAKQVRREDWRRAVFGYTGMIDVSARGEGRRTWKAGSWLGKSFDTFAPIGPCIATLDEIPEPNDVHVQFWVDGQLRHNYNTDDMEHLVPELVEFATAIMTLNSGDVIACGTNHEGLGPLQDGEVVDFEIHGIGRMRLSVRDPLKRTWEKGIYIGGGLDPPGSRAAQPPAWRTRSVMVPALRAIRQSAAALIAVALAVSGGPADGACDGRPGDICASGSPWLQANGAVVKLEEPGSPDYGIWTFSIPERSSLDIETEARHQGSVKRGRIMLVNGKVMLTHGLDLEKGSEIDALDAAVLYYQLVITLLSQAVPGGPQEVTGARAVDLREARRGIWVATSSASGYFAPPWTLKGMLRPHTPERIGFSLALDALVDDARHTFVLTGDWKKAARAPRLDPTLSLESWRMYALGPMSVMRPDGTALGHGAEFKPPSVRTLGELQELLRREGH